MTPLALRLPFLKDLQIPLTLDEMTQKSNYPDRCTTPKTKV